MYADVLLLGLDHPDSLLSHLEDDPEDVHHVGLPDTLQDERRGGYWPTSDGRFLIQISGD